MKELINELKKIEETWGVKAYQDIQAVIFRLQSRIEDLERSRANWRAKFDELNERTKK